LGVDRSTISREIKRNQLKPRSKPLPPPERSTILDIDCRAYRGQGLAQDKYEALEVYTTKLRQVRQSNKFYVSQEATKKARARRLVANQKRTRLVYGSRSWLETYVRRALTKDQWSPEQTAAKLRKSHGVVIYPQTIYDYIYLCPDKKNLVKHLRHGGNPYRHRHGTNARLKARTAHLPSIHDRPKVVESRRRLGDFEGDTIVGLDQKDRILTHVDRASGECKLGLALNYSAVQVTDLTKHRLRRSAAHTITYDRGNEFSDYKRLEKLTKVRVYFADAYHSWERGSSENLNGLVRQYFPKRTDFKSISKRRLAIVERKLNNRPRKRYHWRTPIEQRQYLLKSKRLASVAIRDRI
jgi:IS30 family transposase